MGGETIDIIEGTYRGLPGDGVPYAGVIVKDEDSTFEIAFREEKRELWADLEFHGNMVVYGFVIQDETNSIEGVTVDGVDLMCTVPIEGFSFAVAGTFSTNFSSLFLDVESVGRMTLFLQAEEEPDESDTALDSGVDE